jgi:hypothetical protein
MPPPYAATTYTPKSASRSPHRRRTAIRVPSGETAGPRKPGHPVASVSRRPVAKSSRTTPDRRPGRFSVNTAQVPPGPTPAPSSSAAQYGSPTARGRAAPPARGTA